MLDVGIGLCGGTLRLSIIAARTRMDCVHILPCPGLVSTLFSAYLLSYSSIRNHTPLSDNR